MPHSQRVLVCVTNDLVTDQRVHKMCLSLQRLGLEPLLVGRRRKHSLPLAPDARPYPTHRMRLWFDKGKLFYLEFNFRLFWWLLSKKAGYINSNDLDTLLACFWAARLKGVRLVYDSHEYFTQLPEVVTRPLTQKIWRTLERWLFPKLKHTATVSPQIQEAYEHEYGKRPVLIRNMPMYQPMPEIDFDARRRQKLLIYQGNLKKGRGVELMLQAMLHLPDYRLWLIGGGLWYENMLAYAKELDLQEPQVKFFGLLPMEELPPLTLQASLGLSLEDTSSTNTRFALTNKFFDYIQARVPVLTSAELADQRAVVEQYGIGDLLYERSAAYLAETIRAMVENRAAYMGYIQKMEAAAEALCWDTQEDTIRQLYGVT
ncbi:MAG: glycosyltransferase [Bacteroidota bacterium]